MLELDHSGAMLNALVFLINYNGNNSQLPYIPSSFKPTAEAVSVNSLFFASLSASIIATLASVVTLQWMA